MHARPRTKVALAAALAAGAALAQGGLRVSGNHCRYGARALRPGFTPHVVAMRVGPDRATDVAPLRLGRECAGLVTLEPDVIVRTTTALPLRFAVRGDGDTTLVVNTPDGRWRCDDNSGGGLNPRVDVPEGEPGQYDVWVGRRAAATAPVRAVLTVSQRPGGGP